MMSISAAVETLGPVLESHERFPERANIGFGAVKRMSIRHAYERGQRNPAWWQRRVKSGGGGRIQQGLPGPKKYAWNSRRSP